MKLLFTALACLISVSVFGQCDDNQEYGQTPVIIIIDAAWNPGLWQGEINSETYSNTVVYITENNIGENATCLDVLNYAEIYNLEVSIFPFLNNQFNLTSPDYLPYFAVAFPIDNCNFEIVEFESLNSSESAIEDWEIPEEYNLNLDCDGFCTDETACNYLSEPLNNCFYPNPYEDCSGNCINGENENGECIVYGCTDCMALNWYSVEYDEYNCNPNVNTDDGSCIYPNINFGLDDQCVNIYNWATEWIFDIDISYDESIFENQFQPSPFHERFGFNVFTDECNSAANVTFTPPIEWESITLEITNTVDDVPVLLNAGENVVFELNDFQQDPEMFYDICVGCGTFVDVNNPWLALNINVIVPLNECINENDILNSYEWFCNVSSCSYTITENEIIFHVIYMNSWNFSDENEYEEDNEEEPQPPVGCYYAHINSESLNEVIWENTGIAEFQNSIVKILRQSINYEGTNQYGWEEIGVASITDESFVDNNELYNQFETRYKLQIITEITAYNECEGESISINEWQSNMIRTSVLAISNSSIQDVNLYWNSNSNVDYYKLKRRENNDDYFEDYIDLPHYITSFTDRNPHNGYSEYMVVGTLSNSQYCTPNSNFILSTNIVVNDNTFICSPGCTYINAINYNEEATADDGSCEFEETLSNDCIADLDGSGNVGSTDLLLFLGAFGEVCE